MKRKYVIAVITCGFLFISGICYSCAYNDGNASTVLVSSLSGEEKKVEDSSNENKNPEEVDSENSNIEGQGFAEAGGACDMTQTVTSGTEETMIYVHICGAVITPGVYQVANGARLFDLILLSGGLSKEAAGDYINQAQSVTDGQRIYIPTKEEVDELSTGEYLAGDINKTEVPNEATAFVNINTADAQELMNLPGIGQSKADSIIDYRLANGDFKTIEELMNIPGIKEGLFRQISSYIIVK